MNTKSAFLLQNPNNDCQYSKKFSEFPVSPEAKSRQHLLCAVYITNSMRNYGDP